MRPAMMTVEQLTQALHTEFPQLFKRDGGLQIEAVWHGGGRVRRIYDNSSLRPGGTISGATMMELADFAMYVALLGSIGWLPLAVTVGVLTWAVGLMDGLFHAVLAAIQHVFGDGTQNVTYLLKSVPGLGVILLVLLLLLTGMFVTNMVCA